MNRQREPIPVDELAATLDYLTEVQLCQLANVNGSTAEAWRKRGTGPAFVRFGNTVLYPRQALAEFLRANVHVRRPVAPKDLL